MPPLPSIVPQVVLFTVLGVWLPLQKGIGFLDPVVLGAYACLGVIFAAPAAASGISLLRAIRSGLLLSWGPLLTGVAVIYFTRPVPVGPNLVSLAECGLFGLMLSLAVSGVAALAASRLVARLLLLGVLALFYFWSGWLTDVALTGAAICAVLALGSILLLRRRGKA